MFSYSLHILPEKGTVMINHTTTPSDGKHKPPDDDDIRWFLVKCTVALMFLDIIIFAISGNIYVLGTGTVIGIAVAAVFTFYFKKR